MYGLATRCLQTHHKDQYGSVVPPIYQTSTFEFASCEQGGRRFAGEESGYIYTRLGNPTTAACESTIANLEGSEAAALTSSGMGAISAAFWTILQSGDHVIADNTLYGCTHALLSHGFSKFGVDVTFIDASKPSAVLNALKSNTKVVYFETPANPTLKVIDIRQICEEAHTREGVLVITDNTFASPVCTRPIEYGVDVVIHSVTKYLNGHTDVIAGVVCGKKEFINRVKMEGIKDMTGCVISPNDAFLIKRGLMTLSLRVKKASKNAMKVAEFLQSHPAVERVYYPGLEDHPGHEIAQKQMDYYGSVIAFELQSGLRGGMTLLNNLHLLVLAVSLGGCESLIQHPASMTHACVPREERLEAGITDGMVRLSVGIEDVDDIINDLKQGLDGLM
jgi:methionine-gamma-lyase